MVSTSFRIIKMYRFILCLLFAATAAAATKPRLASPVGKLQKEVLTKFGHITSVNLPNPTEFESAPLSFSGSGDLPKVNTANGLVYGVDLPEAHAFYGIPYAEPPLGVLRFMPPKPAQKFSSPFDATTQTQIACQQVPFNCSNGECDINLSENCLVLDINVPSSVDLSNTSSPPSDKLPVLFWIYGGFFYGGAGTSPLIDGRYLSNTTNTIVVTFNYRVGPFGFLYCKEGNESISGNQGLQDQQLALQWVHDNIEKFGGDKNMVTIFGESSGAQSVMFHLLSDKSKPLFKRAIMESNPAVFPFPNQTESTVITNFLMEAVNCTDLACLRATDATTIANARNEVILSALKDRNPFSAIEPYRPLIDGNEFTDQPMNLFQNGKWQTDKEVMIGSNSQELAYVLDVHPIKRKCVFKKFNRFLLGDTIGDKVTNEYGNTTEGETYNFNLAVELTDMFFTCPTRALARLMAQTSTSNSVYLYSNVYPMSGPGCEAVMADQGVCGYAFHSSEIVFVFRSGPGYGMNFTEDDVTIANMYSEYWGNFAHYGSPSTSSGSNSFTSWPSYQQTNSEDTQWPNILINISQSVEYDYHNDICDFWDATGLYVNPISSTAPQSPTTSKTVTQKPATSTIVTQKSTTVTTLTQSSTTSTMLTQSNTTSKMLTQSSTIPTNVTQSSIISTNVTQSSITPTNVSQSSTTPTNVTHSSTTPTNVTQSSTTPTNVTQSSTTPTNVTQSSTTPTNVTQSSTIPTNVTQSPTIPTNVTQSPTTSASLTKSSTTLKTTTTESNVVDTTTGGASKLMALNRPFAFALATFCVLIFFR